MEFHSSILEIQPEEIDFDFNGHVGNAAITKYLDRGRLQLANVIGLDLEKLKNERRLTVFLGDIG